MNHNLNTFISLDLEMNQPSGKIIQVGIALGKRGESDKSYLVKSWFTDPGEPIAENIIKLTGITDDLIKEQGVSFETVARELGALLDEHQPFVNAVTWGGGDSVELLSAFRERGIEFPYFGRRWIDVKTHHVILALSKAENPAGGLKTVMKRYKVPFLGKAHRADVDAYNTLRLFFHMLNQRSDVIAT